jgi:hypothetical protein
MQLYPRVRIAVLACVIATYAGACKDYPYRHEIAGTVTDAKGAPVASAVVLRVDDKDNAYGVDELYKRTTSDKGEFSFISEGRGPSPMPSAPWRLQVDFGKGVKQVYPLNVAYSAGANGCTGYCAKSLVFAK